MDAFSKPFKSLTLEETTPTFFILWTLSNEKKDFEEALRIWIQVSCLHCTGAILVPRYELTVVLLFFQASQVAMVWVKQYLPEKESLGSFGS